MYTLLQKEKTSNYTNTIKMKVGQSSKSSIDAPIDASINALIEYANRQTNMAIILSMDSDEFMSRLYQDKLPDFKRATPGDPDAGIRRQVQDSQDAYRNREDLRFLSREELIKRTIRSIHAYKIYKKDMTNALNMEFIAKLRAGTLPVFSRATYGDPDYVELYRSYNPDHNYWAAVMSRGHT